MSEKDLFKEIMDNPKSASEQAQVRELKKFHSDTDVIVDVRQKLESLKDDLKDDKQNFDSQITYLKTQKEVPQKEKRYYDKSILKKKPKTVLKHLFSFNETKAMFRKKYGLKGLVTWRFFNFFADKSIFYPGITVYYYIKKFLVLQQELRPHLRKMYRQGWLSEIGEEVLSAYEFNLIGELERIMYDDTILNIMIYYKQPGEAIKKVNSFLGYYFSITRNDGTRKNLIESCEKSLKYIVYEEGEDQKKITTVVEKIKQFTSNEVDENFFIPLFESAFLELYTSEKIRNSVKLKSIEESAYKADNNLQILMYQRQNDFASLAQKKLLRLEREISLISNIKEMVNKKLQTRHGDTLPYLDFCLLAYHNNDKKQYVMRRKSLAAYIFDLCDFFSNVYEFLLVESVNIKVYNEMITAQIFEAGIFNKEVEKIKSSRKDISEFINSEYSLELLSQRVEDKKAAIFVDSINILNDIFYVIGERVLTALGGLDKKTQRGKRVTALGAKDLGLMPIPYYNQKIIKHHARIDENFSLANRDVQEGLQELATFCFCFSYKFEYKMRDFRNSPRGSSFEDKLNNLNNLIEQIELLRSGKDIDI